MQGLKSELMRELIAFGFFFSLLISPVLSSASSDGKDNDPEVCSESLKDITPSPQVSKKQKRLDQRKNDAKADLAIRRAIELADAQLPNRFRTATSDLPKLPESLLTDDDMREAKAEGERQLRAQLRLAGFTYEAKRSGRYIDALVNAKLRLMKSHIEFSESRSVELKKDVEESDKELKKLNEALEEANQELTRTSLLARISETALARISSTSDRGEGQIIGLLMGLKSKHPEMESPPLIKKFGQVLASTYYIEVLEYKSTPLTFFKERSKNRKTVEQYKGYIGDLILAGIINDSDVDEGKRRVEDFLERYRQANGFNPYWTFWRPISYLRALLAAYVDINKDFTEIIPKVIDHLTLHKS